MLEYRECAKKKLEALTSPLDDIKMVEWVEQVLKSSLRDPKTDKPPTQKDIDEMAASKVWQQALTYAKLIYAENTLPFRYKSKFILGILKSSPES